MWPDGEGIEDEHPGRISSGSEVAVLNGQAHTPMVSTLNVHKSTGVHVGPQIYNVTQNVHNTEVIKGRFLGLELISAKHSRRLRCSVAVFVCWAIVVASGLAFYLFHFALNRQQTRLDIGLNETWYLRRPEWQALPALSTDYYSSLPLKYVIIGHSAVYYCEDRYKCTEAMIAIQANHFSRRYGDIGPNFLVGGGDNGLVFEGCGANVIPAMVPSWNVKSIMIMFLGNYEDKSPSQAQFDHVNELLNVLVREKIIQPDYILYGNCQVRTATVSPGRNIVLSMGNFTHWDPVDADKCAGLTAAERTSLLNTG